MTYLVGKILLLTQFWQLVGLYCPRRMVEHPGPSQWEVLTNQMGHPVTRLIEQVRDGDDGLGRLGRSPLQRGLQPGWVPCRLLRV